MQLPWKRIARKLVAFCNARVTSDKISSAYQDFLCKDSGRELDGCFFIIFGSPRSGTTLLAQCLSAHSKIFVPFETDIFVPCAFIMSRVSESALGKEMIVDLITNSYYFEQSLGKYLSVKDVRRSVTRSDYSLPAIFSDLYVLLGKEVGKPIVGDKSPNDINDIMTLFPAGMLNSPIKVIHLVRDVRDLMVSLNRQKWVADADAWFPRLWADRNLCLQAYMRNAPNYFFLRYEDLVAEPVQWLSAISSFLGVEFEPRMLDTASFPEDYKAFPAHRHLHDPIETQRVGEWKTQATTGQLQMYEKQACEALLEFGYLQPLEEKAAAQSVSASQAGRSRNRFWRSALTPRKLRRPL